ncbi:MAG: pyridoxine 5'-phosphate synthase [Bacteroidia bacterium]|nr:pyridoxine 5'-phosphate synthase [Bacteroidia bacterium]
MTKLSVNINKIALIRNSRGKNMPDLLKAAEDIVRFGADGITVHPRPDERHIRKQDVYDLKAILTVELNVEGYPSPEFLKMVEEVKPAQVTLVPDAPDALTSNSGWNTLKNKHLLLEVIMGLQNAGIRTSLFVEPDIEMIEGAREIGTDRIELYTEDYAAAYAKGDNSVVESYIKAAAYAGMLGLGVNAGHDLNQNNLRYFASLVRPLDEVSIGHAIVCESLYDGLQTTLENYKKCLSGIE